MLFLVVNQFEGSESESTSYQATSHHPAAGHFPITARLVMFYSLLYTF